ncbi:MAG: S49 family peptidase, partial [Boseongicola sp.]|nr:S49 family peptidase [Boseongicola sp.]
DHENSRRGARQNEDEDLFNGDIWVGSATVSTGLVDGVGHLVPKMREVFGEKVAFKRYELRRPFLNRFGVSLAADVMFEIEDRLAFRRFGV